MHAAGVIHRVSTFVLPPPKGITMRTRFLIALPILAALASALGASWSS
jgi:hypothetical protein